MNASELRIGNAIHYNGSAPEEYFLVTDLSTLAEHEINDITAASCEPIALTEEWIGRFGFELGAGINKDIWSLPVWDFATQQTALGFIHLRSQRPVQFVHQLQNLYFAFTGEELEIEQPVSSN